MYDEEMADLVRENEELREKLLRIAKIWAARPTLMMYHKEWEGLVSALLDK